MAVGVVPIVYGLGRSYSVDPEAHPFARAGCVVQPQTHAYTHYCELCREARTAWLTRHPEFKDYE